MYAQSEHQKNMLAKADIIRDIAAVYAMIHVCVIDLNIYSESSRSSQQGMQ